MRSYILLTCFVLLTGISIAQQGKITGRVFDATNNEPLPFANIVIWGTNIGSTSDLDGRFIITGLQPGIVSLAASSVGYENYISEEIMVTNAKTITVDIPLKPASVKLEEFVVKASPFRKTEESPLSMRTLDITEIEKSPGANRDISRVIQSLPGVSSSVSYRNDVIVRGGGPSENTFYLDGIEIPNINHFSTQGASGGAVGIINADFIREVNFYSGAFPANRGEALSSVIEFSLLDGNTDKPQFRGSAGATDLALTSNGPIDQKTTYVISARRSYLQFLFAAIGLPFLPTYNDFQFKVKRKINLKNEISVIGLGAIDQFKLNTGIKDPDEEQSYILGYLPVNEQYSYTIGATYRHFRDKSYDVLVLSRNFLNNKAYKYMNNIEMEEAKIFDYLSTEAETKFRYENIYRSGSFKLISGAGFERASYTNRTYQKIFTQDGSTLVDYDSELGFEKWSVFSQASRGFINERLSLSLGVRLDGNNYKEEWLNPIRQFSPRISASWLLTEQWSLNMNSGRYYQLPTYTSLGLEDNEGNLLNKDNMEYISADHFVSGIEYSPDEKSTFTIEGFYKIYDHYPFSVRDSISLASKGGDYGTYGDEPLISDNKGKTWGAEFYFRDKSFLNTNILFSYTFVRSEFQDKKGDFISSAWDNKHLVTLILLREFKKNWNAGIKWRFVGGAPYTPYDMNRSSQRAAWDIRNQGYLDFNRFNTLRLGNFHQLDLRIDKQYFFPKWSLWLYVDIQNLYNFKAEQPDFLTNLSEEGSPDIIDETVPYNEQVYRLRSIPSETGTIIPSIGFIVEF